MTPIELLRKIEKQCSTDLYVERKFGLDTRKTIETWGTTVALRLLLEGKHDP